MKETISLGKIFGIPFNIHPSVFFILVLFTIFFRGEFVDLSSENIFSIQKITSDFLNIYHLFLP